MKQIVKNINGKFELVDTIEKIETRFICDWFSCVKIKPCRNCPVDNYFYSNERDEDYVTEQRAIEIFNKCNKGGE